MGPGRHDMACYGEVHPKCLGLGATGQVSCMAQLALVAQKAQTEKLGPGKAKTGTEGRWLLDEATLWAGPSLARSRRC